MNIKQFKESIKDLPEDTELIVSDSDGNHYSPLFKVEKDCIYIPFDREIMNSFSGDVYRQNEISENINFTEGMKKFIRCHPTVCVLVPKS
jgi:hypothetical protein